VRAAFFAAAERDRAERCLATRFACFDNACLDADRRLSRLSARFVARERFREGFLRRPARPFVRSRSAWRFVRCLPRFGGGNFTPARRALERPIAIACSGDRAPCSPSRMCSISSRTNSPAWVLGDLPSRSSSRARSIKSSSGITKGVSHLTSLLDVNKKRGGSYFSPLSCFKEPVLPSVLLTETYNRGDGWLPYQARPYWSRHHVTWLKHAVVCHLSFSSVTQAFDPIMGRLNLGELAGNKLLS